ncbi:YlbF family regulator [Isobaculum melis]|uniref:Cell fate regulator YlbF, YheA/YmcA/DUF963 family (Controls sporulation, competence, biofilm development) n=1 Tax=Isobaculum melis TaxID=142588 RepID=A0A1H9RV23_9LACT|nr:YlbF family regulator [Isobaculum melis]SER76454.1 Cell fate regulator YlbF, YheA/YmcA/DUF963 family (controls sporulation, competence, biofilm development) [Isobaculum melis]
MIVNDAYFKIEDQALLLVEQIMRSEVARQYKEAKAELQNNESAQQKIQDFQLAKEKFEELSRFGDYAPGFKELRREVRALKRAMDMDEVVASFRFAEMDLQTVLDEVSLTIAKQVSETIKVPTGNPFFESKSGKSGCSSGGSCGCS